MSNVRCDILLLDSTNIERQVCFDDAISYALIVNKIGREYHVIKSRWGPQQTFDTIEELREYVAKYMKE